MSFSRILVPTDLSADCDSAIPVAADLAKRHDAELLLATVSTNRSAQAAETTTKRGLETRAGQVKGVKATTLMAAAEPGKVGDALVQLVTKSNVDLVVVSVRKDGRLGTVATHLAQNSSCPVLLVRS